MVLAKYLSALLQALKLGKEQKTLDKEFLP